MSDKASGNSEEKRDPELSDGGLAGPEGEEISLDPESGDLLDPVERWWNEEIVEEVPSDESDSGDGVADSEPLEADPVQEETSSVVVPPEAIKPLTPLLPDDEEDEVAETEGAEEELKQVEEELEPVETSGKKDDDFFAELEGETKKPSQSTEKDDDILPDFSEEKEDSGDSAGEDLAKGPVKQEDDETGKEEDGGKDTSTEAEGRFDEEGASGDTEKSGRKKSDKGKESGGESSEEEEEIGDGKGDSDENEDSDDEDSDGEKKADEDAESEGETVTDGTSGGEVAVAEAAVVAPVKRKAGCWTIFLNLFFFSTLAVFVALAVGALWVWSKLSNLEYEVAQKVRPALEDQGIFFEYEGWRYQYPRGLVMNGVTLFETAKREKPVLTVSDLGVNLDFLGVIRDRSTPTAIEVSFDDSVLTFFEEAREAGAFSGLTGRLLASRQEVEIERLSARVEGVDVSVAGVIRLSREASGEEDATGPEEEAAAETFELDLAPVMKVLSWFQVESEGAPPSLEVDFSLDADAPETAEVSASLRGRDFRWQEVPFRSASIVAAFEPTTKTIRFSSFQIGYGEGIVGGTMSLELEGQILTIEQMQSTVDLLALASDLDADAKETLAELSFVDAPNVKISGTVPVKDPKLARLDVSYDHRLGLIYAGGGRSLPVRDIRGSFTFNQGILETNDFAGDVLEGNVSVNGSIRLTAEGKPFSGVIEVSSLPLANVGEYYGKGELGMTGDLFLDFRGIGYSEISRIRGGGTIRVDGAKLPAFPVIGPVQEYLGAVVPAFGIQGEGSLSGAYLIESGTLLTNDLTVAQSGAQLVTNGSLILESQTVNFTTKASLEPTLARATGMEDKVIEVSGQGDLADPSLSLSGFPADFAAGKLSEVLGTSPETLGQLKGMISGEGDASRILGAPLDEALGEELGGEVRGLLEGIFGGGEPELAPEAPAPAEGQ